MNRKQRIDKILSNKFDNFLLEIVDNSNLHKGHNNFTGSGETHIKIILTKKDNSPCLLYTSPSPRDSNLSRMPASA